MFMKTGGIAVLAAVFASGAMAQDAPGMDDAVAGAQNQLGVLEYCETEGHIDGAAAEIQIRMSALLPTATDQAMVDAAYEAGKTGRISVMGVDTSLEDAATAQGVDVAALCVQIADVVLAAGAQVPE